MHIFTSAYKLQTKDGVILEPGIRYVVPSHIARGIESELINHAGPEVDYRLSHFNSYERRYHGQTLGAEELLCVYRHGAIGDTLMTTALVAELRRRSPLARIIVFCRPQNIDLWYGLGVDVLGGYPIFDAVKGAWHLFYENMLENDSEPDQGPAIDNMLRFAGIDPVRVRDEHKVPVVVEKQEDIVANAQLFPKFIVLQDGASNGNRTYPHAEALESLLSKEFPEHPIFRVGERNKLPKFRDLIPCVKHAALVICPDSSIGHLAAAFPEVPVISLWGLFHPSDRIKYYKNHHPIFPYVACPHSPCRSHLFVLPHKCKDAPGFDGKSCAVLVAITPEMIIAKAKELLCKS